MTRIGRPAIGTNLAAPAANLKRVFRANVATVAQALQFADEERIPVASMWANVVGHGCDGWNSLVLAELAKRELLQLPSSTASPTFELIPIPNAAGRGVCGVFQDRKSTRLNSSHEFVSRMPSSA